MDRFLTIVLILEIFFIGMFYYIFYASDVKIGDRESSDETKTMMQELCNDMGMNCSGVSVVIMTSECSSCDAMVDINNKRIYLERELDISGIKHELGHLKEPPWFDRVMQFIWFSGLITGVVFERKDWRLFFIMFVSFPIFGFETVANFYSNPTWFLVDFTLFMTYISFCFLYPLSDRVDRIIFPQ